MILTLPTAEAQRARRVKKRATNQQGSRQAAEKFINEEIADAINHAIENGGTLINHPFPTRAYQDKLFVDAVLEGLTSLGYTVYRSHDGGGMYDTFFIKW